MLQLGQNIVAQDIIDRAGGGGGRVINPLPLREDHHHRHHEKKEGVAHAAAAAVASPSLRQLSPTTSSTPRSQFTGPSQGQRYYGQSNGYKSIAPKAMKVPGVTPEPGSSKRLPTKVGGAFTLLQQSLLTIFIPLNFIDIYRLCL